MTTSALILVDIQNDYFPTFPGSKMPLPLMEKAADNAAKLLAHARKSGDAVIHVRHLADATALPFFHRDTPGSEINAAVAPLDHEKVIEKGRPNAFVGSDLEKTLRDLGVEQVTICGAMTQMCVDATVRAAVDLGFDVTVAHDACAAADVEHNGIAASADVVQASIMAPLGALYAKVMPTSACV